MGYWSDLRGWLLKDPVKIIRYLVLFVCCIVVIVQLYECFSKLHDPPISTHSYYNLNETIEMPAVTICRDPPYKSEVLSEISNSYCLHPKYTTCWRKYPFGEISLDEFFTNSTFDIDETFLEDRYGLNTLGENVEITSSIFFNMGRCHTMRPKVALKRAARATGYSMILTHHISYSDSVNRYYENKPGWHIFVHDWRDNFTEIHMKGSGRVDYVFAEINEEIEIKLQNQYFRNVETREDSCTNEEGYSSLKCGEICVWKGLTKKSNCSGPWMHDVLQKDCSGYDSMKNLTVEYEKIYNSDDLNSCKCKQPCESRIFTTYIQNRKSFGKDEPQTQVWIYYTTKLISMIEESPSYDTTQFIADVGGSLGFLLGLSVLGLIGILEHMTLFLCGGLIKKVQLKNEKHLSQEADQHSQNSDETIDIATIASEKEDLKY